MTPGDSRRFEWDEAKRLRNLAKHGFDFMDADQVFDGSYLDEAALEVTGESRRKAVGFCGVRMATIVYVLRGTATRIISMRSARSDERRRHQELYNR